MVVAFINVVVNLMNRGVGLLVLVLLLVVGVGIAMFSRSMACYCGVATVQSGDGLAFSALQ